jgi:SAM-dependent methyltransferase
MCASTESALFDQRTFRGLPVTNLICSTCGLVYQSPRMTYAELSIFYKIEYRRLYQGAEQPDAKDLAVQAGRAEALLAFCDGRLPVVKRHLDIGCSAGFLLQRFKGAYGCRVTGVEPGDLYRKYARSKRLRVFATLDELRARDKKRFDLISLAHVLEHLPDPGGYLSDLREHLLTKNGCLLVEVPNLYAHDSFEVAHLVSFSEHTLRQMLGKAGFEVVALEAHGRPRSRLLPLYLTALARPVEKPEAFQVQPEGGVRFKRGWGMARRIMLERALPWLAWPRLV